MKRETRKITSRPEVSRHKHRQSEEVVRGFALRGMDIPLAFQTTSGRIRVLKLCDVGILTCYAQSPRAFTVLAPALSNQNPHMPLISRSSSLAACVVGAHTAKEAFLGYALIQPRRKNP